MRRNNRSGDSQFFTYRLFFLQLCNSRWTGFTTTGTYAASDISNFKLYYTTTNSFSTANLLATNSSPTSAGTQTFFSPSHQQASNTEYYWITMDVASGAAASGSVNLTVSGTNAQLFSATYTPIGSSVASGQQTINPNAAISLTSVTGTDGQSLCINTAITAITYSVSGGGTGASAAGLPTGVSGSYSGGVFTISGTPTASGTFNYTITTTGTCTQTTKTGSIIVTAANTAGAPSSSPTLCINTALTAITIATTGATGISNDGTTGANSLPAGVSAHWSGNTITISGTPTASGTFNYSIPLTGGCGSVNATGTIIVTAANTAGAPSSSPTLCINTALTAITIATTGATGISNDGTTGANSLPADIGTLGWKYHHHQRNSYCIRYIQLQHSSYWWMW